MLAILRGASIFYQNFDEMYPRMKICCLQDPRCIVQDWYLLAANVAFQNESNQTTDLNKTISLHRKLLYLQTVTVTVWQLGIILLTVVY
jgi:hypothetical protein